MEHINDVMMAEASTLSSHAAGVPEKTVKYIQAAFYFRKRMLVTSVPICIIGLIGNVIVLWLYCCKINETKLAIYIFNMTLANLIIILCNIEVAAFYLAKLDTSSAVQRLLEMLHICGYDTSIYIFTALTAERYLTVYFPVWWQHHQPKHFSIIICVCLWLVSGLESLVEYISCDHRYQLSDDETYVICDTATILAFIMELIIFYPSMFCFTLAIWIRMQRAQQNPPVRLDITIVAIAILYLILKAPVRLANIISLWITSINWIMLNSISLLLDCFGSSIIPFVFLIVGCWNRRKAFEPIHMFLDRALKDAENIAEPTEVDTQKD